MQALAIWLERLPAAARLAVLFVVAALVFAPGQMQLPVIDRDEARFVQAARQMVETGDFIDIRFQQDMSLGKPVGIYWLQAAAATLAGDGTRAPVWVHRLPSLLGAALAVALTGWAVAPLAGASAGMLAALLLGATMLLHVEARLARIDAALLATVVLAQGALLRLWLAERPGRGLAIAFWAAIGLGVLLKGPVIAVPVAGALGALALSSRRLQVAAFRPLLGLGIVAAIVAPWLIGISIVSGSGFWQAFVTDDIMAKVGAMQDNLGGPPGTHVSLFFGTFWPFAVLVPFAALGLWQRRREAGSAFLLGWIVPTWIVFEIVPTKLPHYVLVTYPAIAAAVALSLPALADRARPDGWVRGLMLFGWGLPAVAFVVGSLLAVPVIEGRLDLLSAAAALVGAGLLGVAGLAMWHWRVWRFAGASALGGVVLSAGLFHFTLPALDRVFVAPRLAEAAARYRCGATGTVAVTGFVEPSAVVALGTDVILTEGAGAGVVLRDGRAALAFVADDQMAAFAEVAGARATALTRIEGFNHAEGAPVALTLYAFDRQTGAACDP